jgi:hypothetical protein
MARLSGLAILGWLRRVASSVPDDWIALGSTRAAGALHGQTFGLAFLDWLNRLAGSVPDYWIVLGSTRAAGALCIQADGLAMCRRR